MSFFPTVGYFYLAVKILRQLIPVNTDKNNKENNNTDTTRFRTKDVEINFGLFELLNKIVKVLTNNCCNSLFETEIHFYAVFMI